MKTKVQYNRIKDELKLQQRSNAWLHRMTIEKKAKISENTIGKYCRNETQPTLDVLAVIADILKVNARELLVFPPRRTNKPKKNNPMH